MKLKIKWMKTALYILVPLVVAGSVGFYLRTEKDFFVVREVPVAIEHQASQEALLIRLRPEIEKEFSALKGLNIWKVDLGQFRQKVLNHKWVGDVELRRRFPDKISALIHLKKPILLFVDAKNRFFPVMDGGESIEPGWISTTPLVPILRNNKIFTDKKMLKKVLGLYKAIPPIGPFKATNIASVDYHPVTGLTVELIEEDVVVHLGNQDIQTKGLQITRVIDYLKSQKQKARVIDGSFRKKVLVRPRKGS